MHKLVKILADRAAQQQERQLLLQYHPQQQQQGYQQALLLPLDPSQLVFARTVYLFQASTPSESSLQEKEIMCVMGKLDPSTGLEVDPQISVKTEWTRESREGWFPRKFVDVLGESPQR